MTIQATSLSQLRQSGADGAVELADALQNLGADVRGVACSAAELGKEIKASLAAFSVFRSALRWDELPAEFEFPNVGPTTQPPTPMKSGAGQLSKEQIDALIALGQTILAAIDTPGARALYVVAGGKSCVL
jgi:hypothetical protein